MHEDVVIEIQHLSKIYKLYDNHFDRLKETFNPFNKKYHTEFYALNDLSVSIRKGEVVGLVGINGSGKSTLLQIITGVLNATSGTVSVTGRISALLELGAGFNPDLSGIENVYFKSSLLGVALQKNDPIIDDIISFADIGKFIHQPVKTYSSGMYVRLAFAVAINVDPDILIIDEALSVGDFRFRQKCLRRIKEFQDEGRTILFVSHDTGAIVEFCSRAIWLHDGKVFKSGLPTEVCKDYTSLVSYGAVSGVKKLQNKPIKASDSTDTGHFTDTNWVSAENCSSYGAMGAEITRVSFCLKGENKKLTVFEGGKRVVFSVAIHAKECLENPIIGFHLCDRKGVKVLGMNTCVLGVNVDKFNKDDNIVIQFEFDFPFLQIGNYSFSPAIADGNQVDNTMHHWIHDAYLIKIVSTDVAANMGNYFIIKENFKITIN